MDPRLVLKLEINFAQQKKGSNQKIVNIRLPLIGLWIFLGFFLVERLTTAYGIFQNDVISILSLLKNYT